MTTIQQYDAVIARCRDLFSRKAADYGTSWRVLRPISITDQIYIKAWRIRHIQEQGFQVIGDSIESELVGIVNYGLIALIQERHAADAEYDWTPAQALAAYDHEAAEVRGLMLAKNTDYGEAWRDMSQQGKVDLILVKLLRIRQILANDGRTQVSEGTAANFSDIINYAVFALILAGAAQQHSTPTTLQA